MNQGKSDKLGAAFAQAVKGVIGNDRNHGWGLDDSFEVIEAIVAEDAIGAEKGKYVISDEAASFVKKVINPSAFRQVLEGKEINLLNKSESGKGNRASEMAKLFAGK